MLLRLRRMLRELPPAASEATSWDIQHTRWTGRPVVAGWCVCPIEHPLSSRRLTVAFQLNQQRHVHLDLCLIYTGYAIYHAMLNSLAHALTYTAIVVSNVHLHHCHRARVYVRVTCFWRLCRDSCGGRATAL